MDIRRVSVVATGIFDHESGTFRMGEQVVSSTDEYLPCETGAYAVHLGEVPLLEHALVTAHNPLAALDHLSGRRQRVVVPRDRDDRSAGSAYPPEEIPSLSEALRAVSVADVPVCGDQSDRLRDAETVEVDTVRDRLDM